MMDRPIRLLGLTMDAGADWKRSPGAKNAGLYAALAARYDVVGLVRPVLPAPEDALHRLLHFHPDRERWRNRYNKSPLTFARRTALAERRLQEWDGRQDLIVQLHTMVGPGTTPRPYVLHTDNTYALSERHWAPWAPLSARARAEWMLRERAIYQGARFLFPRSEWLRRSFIEDYGCDPARVVRVGGGANLQSVSLDGKRHDARIALFVGLEFRRKGGRELLRAWEHVRRRLPDARLQIAGETARGHPAAPGVEWLGKVSDRGELARLYRAASVFVMPSLFEPWGHVFYEAMGHGLPCVGTDCCAMPEIIEHGVTGLLVPPGQPGPLADALVALLDNPEQAATMGHAAHGRVRTGHTWDDVVERMSAGIELAAAGCVNHR